MEKPLLRMTVALAAILSPGLCSPSEITTTCCVITQKRTVLIHGQGKILTYDLNMSITQMGHRQRGAGFKLLTMQNLKIHWHHN